VFRPAVTNAITEASMNELIEQGYARLSMERVARRAGVSKSALYRRWPGKVEMVVDVLAGLSVPTRQPAGTGSVRGDVRLLLEDHLQWLRDPQIEAILPDLIAESRRNPALAEATEKFIGQPRRRWAAEFLQRTVGPTLTEAESELILDVVAAPPYWRLVHDRVVDPAYLARLVDLVVDGLQLEDRRSPAR
jgi:AcrR family transcriptional regulator